MSFLDQLQQSAGLLSNQVQSVNPFGDYSPTLASDYVSGVPQNRFVGNQFQMPSLGSGVVQQPTFATPNVGSNFGTYTPSPFISPSTSTVTTTQPNIMPVVPGDRGGVQGEGGLDSTTAGVSTQFVGDKAYRFNPDGTFTELDPESLDYKFNKFSYGLLDKLPSVMNITKGLVGEANPMVETYNTVKLKYGEDVANQFGKQSGLFDTVQRLGIGSEISDALEDQQTGKLSGMPPSSGKPVVYTQDTTTGDAQVAEQVYQDALKAKEVARAATGFDAFANLQDQYRGFNVPNYQNFAGNMDASQYASELNNRVAAGDITPSAAATALDTFRKNYGYGYKTSLQEMPIGSSIYDDSVLGSYDEVDPALVAYYKNKALDNIVTSNFLNQAPPSILNPPVQPISTLPVLRPNQEEIARLEIAKNQALADATMQKFGFTGAVTSKSGPVKSSQGFVGYGKGSGKGSGKGFAGQGTGSRGPRT